MARERDRFYGLSSEDDYVWTLLEIGKGQRDEYGFSTHCLFVEDKATGEIIVVGYESSETKIGEEIEAEKEERRI